MNHGDMKKAQRLQPPEKGSFPLDHDGDCKAVLFLFHFLFYFILFHFILFYCDFLSSFFILFLPSQKMKVYMGCLGRNEMVAEKCRGSLKSYLECRMEELE